MQGSLRVIKISHYLFKAMTQRMLPVVECSEVREKLLYSHQKKQLQLINAVSRLSLLFPLVHLAARFGFFPCPRSEGNYILTKCLTRAVGKKKGPKNNCDIPKCPSPKELFVGFLKIVLCVMCNNIGVIWSNQQLAKSKLPSLVGVYGPFCDRSQAAAEVIHLGGITARDVGHCTPVYLHHSWQEFKLPNLLRKCMP